MILIVCKVLCVAALFSLLHTYILFPLLMRLLLRLSSKEIVPAVADNELPLISILIAAHNEEKVIGEKLQSIINNHYPEEKIEVLIGSDSSTDKTDERIESYREKYAFIKLIRFHERRGKPSIINQLAQHSKGSVLIITDANVMFDKDTLRQLVIRFIDNSVGLADTRMVNTGMKKSGISHQEKTYISAEVITKYAEGRIWGCMMGPFGGCYAIRKELFQPIPENNLVDDFYVNMKVLEQGYKCISAPSAVVFEQASNNLLIEYKRKTRIATGNFQNLKIFRQMMWKGRGIGFCFWSHKVLRWGGPLFLIIALCCSGILVLTNNSSLLFTLVFAGLSLSLIGVVLDRILNLTGIHFNLFRLNTHFVVMNMALLKGLIRYLAGVKSGIWQPTQREQ